MFLVTKFTTNQPPRQLANQAANHISSCCFVKLIRERWVTKFSTYFSNRRWLDEAQAQAEAEDENEYENEAETQKPLSHMPAAEK